MMLIMLGVKRKKEKERERLPRLILRLWEGSPLRGGLGTTGGSGLLKVIVQATSLPLPLDTLLGVKKKKEKEKERLPRLILRLWEGSPLRVVWELRGGVGC
eukprot:TRINITY_DN3150_c0_g1_i1.p2 TRINITY_DN3150_c0_g1~~TRINITY_DN3150_c0_g1_i1.p2  ORF type:complete len:101 (+),score=1.00 TRINITY_DN3150_c0_g1_i1:666-968(+)